MARPKSPAPRDSFANVRLTSEEREEIEKGTADLEAFLAQMGQPNTITTTTPTAEMNDLLDAYQERLIDNVKDADEPVNYFV